MGSPVGGVGGTGTPLGADVLGGLGLRVGTEPIPLRGERRRALVALLLAESPRPVSVERLVDDLRDGESTAARDPANAVHAHVARLRRLLGGASAPHRWLVSGVEGYALTPDVMDLWDYEQHLQRAAALQRDHPAAALRAVEAARALWGRPWGDLELAALDEPRRRLELRHAALEETWAALVLDLGRGVEHADAVMSLARAEPTRERRWALAMRALVQAGRQVDALGLYDEARTFLVEEVGIEPGPELRAMHQAVLRQDAELLARPPDAPTPALPRPAGVFFGRERELDDLEQLSARSRLVTVAGLGGVGKSRMVAQWASASGREVDTVWVELRGVTEGSLVDRLAGALGVVVSDGSIRGLVERASSLLEHRPTLLVLDGADAPGETEETLSAVVSGLLALTVDLTVVVTRRRPLGLSEERVLELGPLPLPTRTGSLDGTAGALAFERLGRGATEAEARAVALQGGGIPLAVEVIAAGRSHLRAPVTPRSDVPVAQRTPADPGPEPVDAGAVVRMAVDDAVLHLSPQARGFLRLAVHLPGGMCGSLATAVSDEGCRDLSPVEAEAQRARVLRELVGSSLVVTSLGERGVRYVTLAPVVDARRTEDAAAQAETVELLERWTSEHLRTNYFETPVRHQLATVAEEVTNLGAALRWCEREDPSRVLGLATRSAEAWAYAGRVLEVHRWLRNGLDWGGPPDLQARALVALGNSRGLAYLAGHGAEIERARTLLQEAGLVGGDLWAVTHAQRAVVLGWQGDRAGVEAAVEEVRRTTRRAGSPWFEAIVRELEGMACLPLGRPLEGVRACRDAADRFEALGDPDAAAVAMYFACVLGRLGGMDSPALGALVDEARERAGPLVSLKSRALVAAEVARHALALGGLDRVDELVEALRLTERAGNLHHAANGRRDLGLALLAAGRSREAAHHLRSAARHLLHLDRAAAALAVAGLAAAGPGRDREVLTALAWSLASVGEGTPVTDADRARIVSLAGPAPAVTPALSTALARAEGPLGLPPRASSSPLFSTMSEASVI